MGERVASDNPAVDSLRGRLVRRGGTRRPAVAVPADERDVLPAAGTVRVIIDGSTRFAPVGERGDTRAFLGAYDNARRGREREGTDRLAEWVEARGLDIGRSVTVDVLEPGEAYGLRVPGEDAVYEVDAAPTDSLRRIAEGLDQ